MQRISVRRQQLDNQNNKRWSTSIIDNNDQEEQISCQSSCLTLLTNKLRSNSNITSGDQFVLRVISVRVCVPISISKE
ncbi:unnamed protein product [Rotaria magnacalcarata]|uniref:Uncharacterized protein n=1 Tax=Rotaria magnacalcarata TaxID=392030 RepID=A0A8S3CNL4_9BILA|nr:unnamed protein product [Rotaria magnacalcarata]